MITMEEKVILRDFLDTKIPIDFKLQDVYNEKRITIKTSDDERILDAMYCYEEISDYVHSLLSKKAIKKNCNFFDKDAIIFCFDFVKYLEDLGSRYPSTQNFCKKMIAVFEIIKNHIL